VQHLLRFSYALPFDTYLLMPTGVPAHNAHSAFSASEQARKKGAAHLIRGPIHRRRGQAYLEFISLKTAHAVFARAWLYQHGYQGAITIPGYAT
jgi:hypothetical protein